MFDTLKATSYASKCQRYVLNDHLKRKGTKTIYDLTNKDKIKICVFVCSSTGNGDMPDNGETFHRFLRRETNKLDEGEISSMLSHVFYTILGLGDSNYSKF